MRWLIMFFYFITLLISGCFYGSSLYFREPQSQDIPNLVINPSFEKADPQDKGLPANWFIISSSIGEKEPVALDSVQALAHRKSLKITEGTRNLYILSDAFRINHTGGFFIKCSVKSQKPMRKAVRVHFWAYDNAGDKKNSFSRKIKADKDWKQVTISAGFLKNTVNFGRIAIFVPKDPDNTIWIDDIGCYTVHRFTRE